MTPTQAGTLRCTTWVRKPPWASAADVVASRLVVPKRASLSRAADFIRMAAISHLNIKLAGSHAGVSIGEDGPSQMALEDLAMMRAVHGSTVLYPSDGNATAALVASIVHEAPERIPEFKRGLEEAGWPMRS